MRNFKNFPINKNNKIMEIKNMKALVTGASSGIGRDMAKILSKKVTELIIVARSQDKLIELKKELKCKVKIIVMDLSKQSACFKLFELVKNENIDIVINNAGFGLFGKFTETDIGKELNMIDLNVKSIHILTKLFLKQFKERDYGYILNVSSLAAYMPGGPLLSSYYASKSYVFSLTASIYEELKFEKSNVYIGALCPGPVNTNFNNRAGGKFMVKGLSSYYVAKYALSKMLKKKTFIIPGNFMKFAPIAVRIFPTEMLLKFCYKIQKSKL